MADYRYDRRATDSKKGYVLPALLDPHSPERKELVARVTAQEKAVDHVLRALGYTPSAGQTRGDIATYEYEREYLYVNHRTGGNMTVILRPNAD